MKKQPMLNNFLLLTFVIMTFIVKAQPTNNPVHDYYPDSYKWTNSIKWNQTFNIMAYGGVADGNAQANTGTDNIAAFNAARDAAFAAGGGVVYFPAGTYFFTDNIYVKSGVVLRGETPSVTNALNDSFNPASNLLFPKYTLGAPRNSAFKRILSFDANNDINFGLVFIDVNRADIRFDCHPTLGRSKNVIILGVRNNNAAQLSPQVPAIFQPAWSCFPDVFESNILIQAYQNILLAKCRLNDSITDNFEQIGYVARSSKTWGPLYDTLKFVDQGTFRYSDHPAFQVNINHPFQALVQPPGAIPGNVYNWFSKNDSTVANANSQFTSYAPGFFRENIAIRDNWAYRTKRYGVFAAGVDMLISGNVIKDKQEKTDWLNPNGLSTSKGGIQFDGNRGIWINGGGRVLVENNITEGYQHLCLGGIGIGYLSNDGEGIVMDNQGSQFDEGVVIRNNDITCNWSGFYDIGNKNISFINNTIHANNAQNGGIFIECRATAPGGADDVPGKLSNIKVIGNKVDNWIFIDARAQEFGDCNEIRDNVGDNSGNIWWTCGANVLATGNTNFTSINPPGNCTPPAYNGNCINIEAMVVDSIEKATKRIYVSVKESTSSHSLATQVTLFPNPVKDVITIKREDMIGSALISIYSLSGIEIYKSETSDARHLINVSHLKNGLYIVQVVTNEKKYNFKLSKE